jgi:hypothetical protein
MIVVHKKKIRSEFSCAQQCNNRQKNIIFNTEHFLIYATPFRRVQLIKRIFVSLVSFLIVSLYVH